MEMQAMLKRFQSDLPDGGNSAENGAARRETGSQMRKMTARDTSSTPAAYSEIKNRIQNKLIQTLDNLDVTQVAEIRKVILSEFDTILSEENIILSRPEKIRISEQIIAEILGLGPIQKLLEDDEITEVMVNGPRNIYVERKGKIQQVPITFESNEHVKQIIDRIVAPLGRRIDESSPYVDARLPDGSRVNAIIPPIALSGPTITIRKFSKNPITVEQLYEFGSISQEAMQFLQACVASRLNVIISGGTGSGKTTLLNILSDFIPDDERIITIENAAELQLRQNHVITLESRPPNIEGKGEITIRQLVVNALRMRPDRIIVGEVRAGETIDMLQAMNTGHEGSMTTLHANSPHDVLSRLETMTLMAGIELPMKAIREQIASAIDLIVHQSRMRDGTRKVVNISEVRDLQGDTIVMNDIFVFEQQGIENSKVIGRMRPTGVSPQFLEKIELAGIHLPPSLFGIQERRH
jgi:pilus assembly protein CpaF